MSFLSKVLKVATGGLSGPIGSLARGDVRGAGIGALTGGVVGGRSGAGSGPGSLAGAFARLKGQPSGPMAVDPGAQAYLNTFSPEDQQSINAGLVGQQNGLNNWFRAAQAAGAVPSNLGAPAPPAAAPMAAPQAGPVETMETPRQRAARQQEQQLARQQRGAPPPIAQELAFARRKFQLGRPPGGLNRPVGRLME